MSRTRVTQGIVTVPGFSSVNIQHLRVLPASNGSRNYFYCRNNGPNAVRCHWNTSCTNDGGDIILAVGEILEMDDVVPQDAFNVLGVILGGTTLVIVEGNEDLGRVANNG